MNHLLIHYCRILLLVFFCAGVGLVGATDNPQRKSIAQDLNRLRAEVFPLGPGLTSINLEPFTILKVRSSNDRGTPWIIASTYEGDLIALTHEGTIQWTHPLSGTMNRDIWCEDLDGDSRAEILAANADGTLYCLSSQGELRWKFKPTDAPMGAVTVIHHKNNALIVCGGYDKSIYYLDTDGNLIDTLPSSEYSTRKPWGRGKGSKRTPADYEHIANFIRTVQIDGEDILLVQGTLYGHNSHGSVYFFRPLERKPFKTIKNLNGVSGDLKIVDTDQDGNSELLYGSSGMIQDAIVGRYDLANDEAHTLELKTREIRRNIDAFGYRVAQSEIVTVSGEPKIYTSFGSRVLMSDLELGIENTELLKIGYSFNDLWKDEASGKLLLASSQSGGSCIHIVDPTEEGWQKSLTSFEPHGKLKKLLTHVAEARKQLEQFKRPTYERELRPVFMLTESLGDELEERAEALQEEYGSPVFFNRDWSPRAEDWDRSSFGNTHYEKRRDQRRRYDMTQEEALDFWLKMYDGWQTGIAAWGGHGNDPMMFSLDTMKKVTDAAGEKKPVFIYPELEQYDDNFKYLLDHHIYPLAEHIQGTKGKLYIRTKHAFWHGIVYKPLWSRLLSGEFADVFVASMEETSDKTMEQTVAARVGLWASGAIDDWGSRAARDNPSFDRLREHSHQMVPNHFLRAQIYNIALGSNYQNNFPTNQDYFSILYELISKGALYVPKRNEIVSLNPVHLSIAEPDPLFMDQGNNIKWLTFFDQEFEDANRMVFGRLDGSWPGAPVNPWDFSQYAAGVHDRRLNFLPPYNHGLVMITPPQNGVFADKRAPRGQLRDHLHPMYKNLLQEYITDGRDYISPDGKTRFAADEYYTKIAAAIAEGARKLPVRVEGDVAWVVAQSSPKHLRLTLIDSGYINPRDRTAKVHFQSIQPKRVTNLLDKTEYSVSENTATIDVPCGLFRLIEIELEEEL
ncbi:MAG: hypothetical protein AAF571_12605 [Verrucomicrobiota bacterium]